MNVVSSRRRFDVRSESWPIAGTFRLSRGAKTRAEVVVVELAAAGAVGRGESVPYARYGESVEGVLAQLHGLSEAVCSGVTRAGLPALLPPGAARNALDCALWDLEARMAGRPVHALAGLGAPGPVVTSFTLSLDRPEAMGAAARRHAHLPALKLKIGGRDGADLARVRAVRAAAPASRISVDVNEGWGPERYASLAPELAALGVSIIEQPLRAGADEALASLPRPVPVCADESCHDRASLPALAGRYDLVNLKLDKCGGLTEALATRDAARAAGFGIMVGCMVSTSLAVAPAFLVAQGADAVDLDGPLLLERDREHGLRCVAGQLKPPAPALWGGSGDPS